MVLGAWLVASVFLWRHGASDGFNTLMSGILVLTFAPAAVWAPSFRYAASFVAAWLLGTALFFEHPSAATLPNNVLVAGLILAISLVSSEPRTYRERRAQV
jgi:hypothetical protein